MNVASKHTSPRLSGEELRALNEYGARASWPAGFTIYERGTPADGIFIVTKGRIVLRTRVKAGRAFAPAVALEGETFGAEGLVPEARYATDARADEESETLFLGAAKFRAVLREAPHRAVALVSQLMADRAALLDRLRELATLSVEQRLVSALVRLGHSGDFATDDGRIRLGQTQYRLLCEMVGATRESVALVLSRFVGEGLAERQGATVLVAGPSKLASRALRTALGDTEASVPLGVESGVQGEIA